MSMHPQDRLAALEKAVKHARDDVAAGLDPLAAQDLAALLELRDEAKREAGR